MYIVVIFYVLGTESKPINYHFCVLKTDKLCLTKLMQEHWAQSQIWLGSSLIEATCFLKS